jgi:hypothetical protein
MPRRPPPPRYPEQLQVSVNAHTRQEFEAEAERLGLSNSELLRTIITDYLSRLDINDSSLVS